MNPQLNRQKGYVGESIAVEYLRKNGFKILQQNYAPKTNFQGGEIDIIAQKDNMIHFIEVKARGNNSFGYGREAVTPTKQKLIRRVAMRYLVENDILQTATCCFDVVEISGTYLHRKIEYFENCF